MEAARDREREIKANLYRAKDSSGCMVNLMIRLSVFVVSRVGAVYLILSLSIILFPLSVHQYW